MNKIKKERNDIAHIKTDEQGKVMDAKEKAILATQNLREALANKDLFPSKISYLEEDIRKLCSYMLSQAIMKGK